MASKLSGGRWITVNGEHRYIGSDGSVEAGRPFFKPDSEVRETDFSHDSAELAGKSYPARPSFSAEEDKVVKQYVRGSGGINKPLQKAGADSKIEDPRAQLLQKTILNAPITTEDQVVYRHFKHDPKLAEGQMTKMGGFLSNSTLSDGSFATAGKYGFEIAIPKGSKGVLMGHNPDETEATLSHGSQFKVLGVKQLSYRGGTDWTKPGVGTVGFDYQDPKNRVTVRKTIYQLAYLGPGETS